MLIFQLAQRDGTVELSAHGVQRAEQTIAATYESARTCIERAINVAAQETPANTSTRTHAISRDYLLQGALREADRIRDREQRSRVQEVIRAAIPETSIGLSVEAFKIRILGGTYQSAFGTPVPEEGTLRKNQRSTTEILRAAARVGSIDLDAPENALVGQIMKPGGIAFLNAVSPMSESRATEHSRGHHRRNDPYDQFQRQLQNIPETQLFKIGEDRESLGVFAENLRNEVEAYNQAHPNHRISDRTVRRVLNTIREMSFYGEPVEVGLTRDMEPLREILPRVLGETRLGMFEESHGTHDYMVFCPRWRAQLEERATTGSPLGVNINEPRVRELVDRMEELFANGIVGDAQIDAVRRAQVALGLHQPGRVITETQVENARRILGL